MTKNASNKHLEKPNNIDSNKQSNSTNQNNTFKPYKLSELNSIKQNKINPNSSNGSNSNNINNKSDLNYNYYSIYNYINDYDFDSTQFPNGKNKSSINYTVSNFNSNENRNKKYNYIDNKSQGKEEYQDHKVNLINLITGKDKRTTIMLRNIPNKYTLQNLVDEINSLFLGKYDYINLPIDFDV